MKRQRSPKLDGHMWIVDRKMDIGQGYQLSLIEVLGRVQSFVSMEDGKRKMLMEIMHADNAVSPAKFASDRSA